MITQLRIGVDSQNLTGSEPSGQGDSEYKSRKIFWDVSEQNCKIGVPRKK
jgi:hypothetical protein